MTSLTLKLIDEKLSIHRFPATAQVPAQIYKSNFYTISKTDDELSIVCSQSVQISGDTSSTDWRGFKVLGPLDFSLTGIMAELSTVLARANISIFAISTYDTDYILVKADKTQVANEALAMAGYSIV